MILKASVTHVTLLLQHLRAMRAQSYCNIFLNCSSQGLMNYTKKNIFWRFRWVPNIWDTTIRTLAERIRMTYVYGTLSSFENSNVAALLGPKNFQKKSRIWVKWWDIYHSSSSSALVYDQKKTYLGHWTCQQQAVVRYLFHRSGTWIRLQYINCLTRNVWVGEG